LTKKIKNAIIKPSKGRRTIKMTKKEMEFYDQLVELEIATPEELNLARNLMAGTWEEVLAAVLYIRTGYRNLWQMFEEEEEEE
jgi:hypothetical protein